MQRVARSVVLIAIVGCGKGPGHEDRSAHAEGVRARGAGRGIEYTSEPGQLGVARASLKADASQPTGPDTVFASTKDLPRVTRVAGTFRFQCSLLDNGHVECLGNNGSGKLGNGTTDDSEVAVRVSGIEDATELTCGVAHCCALLQSRNVVCWGNNSRGQLGDTTGGHSSVPKRVAGVSGAVALDGHRDATCVVTETGTVLCWGRDNRCLPAPAVTTEREVVAAPDAPTEVPGMTTARLIALGNEWCSVVTLDGEFKHWGNTVHTPIILRLEQEEVSLGIMPNATRISAGDDHVCALLDDGQVSCWGFNTYGQLGNGGPRETIPSRQPLLVAGISNAKDVIAFGDRTCTLLSNGSIACWGYGTWGPVGPVNLDDPFPPTTNQPAVLRRRFGITGLGTVFEDSWDSLAAVRLDRQLEIVDDDF